MRSQDNISTLLEPELDDAEAQHPEDARLPREMDLSALARRCAAERERFQRNQPHDSRFAYELFRRALAERDECAWEHLYAQYCTLVGHWVRSTGAFAHSGESSEFFVTAAFARFWRAISPERFTSFPTLAALLDYLQHCAACAVIDSTRGRTRAELLPVEAIPRDRAPQRSSEEEAMEQISRAEFWSYIATRLHDEAERVVIMHSFVRGMKPSDIFHQRQDLFKSVNDVYMVKRNVLIRLSHDRGLRRMLRS